VLHKGQIVDAERVKEPVWLVGEFETAEVGGSNVNRETLKV